MREMGRRFFELSIILITVILLIHTVGCKKVSEVEETQTYYITVHAKEISEGFNPLEKAQITIGNQIISSGEQIVHEGDNITVNTTGGHNTVLVLRGGYMNDHNLYQSQNGESITVNLGRLGSEARQGDNVVLELYKIPSRINIADVKEALIDGTAVYDKSVTFYPVNEGYSASEFEKVKTNIIGKVNNILNQLNTIPGMKGCNYDPNKTSGKQRIRLSPDYINAGHGESGSGVMDWSEIKISEKGGISVYLEELYQAMGVRNDIGADNSIRDDIANYDTLNQFGRDLMVINYFLEPGTKL